MFDINTNKVFFISEIGINHNGSFDLAIELIEKSIESGADIVKFQIRNLVELYPNSKKDSFGLGSQYIYDIIKKFDLEFEAYLKLFEHVKKNNAIPLCTPFDQKSLDLLIHEKFNFFKIASADLENLDLIKKAAENSDVLILSTGMHNENQIIQTNKYIKGLGKEPIFLHCNSTYPAPFQDINLNYIKRLKEITNCKYVGYSGHERGYHIPLAAISLGAKIIEKHFSLDRDMEGPDHKVSLLPNEFKEMVSRSRDIETALGEKDVPKKISQGEIINREALSKSVYSNKDIKENQVIKYNDLVMKSPAVGLDFSYIQKLVGKRAIRKKKIGEPFELIDLSRDSYYKRKFKFSRKFGVPVRYHDFKNLYKKSNLDFLEFHLSYNDMDLNYNEYLNQDYDCGLIVHAPDLYKEDHILNLASKNPDRSIYELQRVIDLTTNLKKFFKEHSPKIVVSIGGYTRDKKASEKEVEEMISNLVNNFKKIDTKGNVILAQTLPPYPWYIGGQMYCNLFTTPEDVNQICSNSTMKLCLDISHTQLSANEFKYNFEDFLKLNGKFIEHLHLVDALNHNSEGLQIEEGEINWAKIIKLLNKFSPNASFIPEIWQGHLNDGNGFWVALERLQKYNL